MQAKLVSFLQAPIFGLPFKLPDVLDSKSLRLQSSSSASASSEKKHLEGEETFKPKRCSGNQADKHPRSLPIPPKSLFPAPLTFLWFDQGSRNPGDCNAVKDSEVRTEAGNSADAERGRRTKANDPSVQPARRTPISSPLVGHPERSERPAVGPEYWREEDLIDREKVSGDPEVVHGIENPAIEEAAAVAAESLMEIRTCDQCLDCASCNVEYDSDSGSPDTLNEKNFVGITHTADTFKKYLKQAHLGELKTASLMSVLSDLAYTIKAINSEELFRKYGLVMITSSISQKAEQVPGVNSGIKNGPRVEPKASVSKNGERKANHAYSFASAAISYIHSQSLSMLPIKHSNPAAEPGEAASENPLETLIPTGVQTALSPQPTEHTSKSFMDNIPVVQFQPESIPPFSMSPSVALIEGSVNDSQVNPNGIPDSTLRKGAGLQDEIAPDKQSNSQDLEEKDVPQIVAVEKMGIVVEAPLSCDVVVEGNVSNSSQNPSKSGILGGCPCEWFVCDDDLSRTRYFVIQGSDSIASWQTNISFDPVVFEKPEFRVMVHRGIYDAAKALYKTLSPLIKSHACKFGSSARIAFTGHSLGGSLATLLMLMAKIRLDIPSEMLKPVYTFGSPSIMCGGDRLLDRVGFSRMQVRQVMMHMDLVPRAFACDYPDHVAGVLRRISGSFRHHPCLQQQKLMYAHMGTTLILQPGKEQAPFHHLMPLRSGLFYLQHPSSISEFPQSQSIMDSEVRSALRSLLNSPHPLEILADPRAYGTDGSISKYHNPTNYSKALHEIRRSQLQQIRRIHRPLWLLERSSVHLGYPEPSGGGARDLPPHEFVHVASRETPPSVPASYTNRIKGGSGRRRRRRSGSLLPRAFSADDLPSSQFPSHPSPPVSVLTPSSAGRWRSLVASHHTSLLAFLASSYSYFHSPEPTSGFDCSLFS